MATHQHINDLAIKAQQGDEAALVELIAETKGYVRNAVKRVTRTGSSVEEADLMAEGKVSILRHLPRYDPARGNFGTFIFTRLRGDVMKAASQLYHGFPIHHRSLGRYRAAVAAADGDLTAARGMAPEQGLALDTFDRVHEAVTGVWHLSTLTSDGEGEAHSFDVQDQYNGVAEAVVIDRMMADEVHKALCRLEDREREVLELVYGFRGEALSDGEVATLLGIDRSRVCRIRNRAQQKLAGLLEESK